jgi:dienelactone hydrolase
MCLTERMGIPDIGGMPEVTVKRKYIYDGLIIEELSWQLPYGRPTEAILLKPANVKQPLPGILAFHDHGGNKYFGTRKITKTSEDQHSLLVEHQNQYYSGRAWANEIAKKGYIVLVSDAFAFASRRVMLQDVPEKLREGLSDENTEDSNNIALYNHWASNHEEVMAKSLFSAGTTWPGMIFAEDRKALDILCARKDVDSTRIGCGGLSGGGLRLPLPTMVLNDSEDSLYTLPLMNAANNILKEIFDKANAADRYRCSFYQGGHKFDANMQKEAFDWFDRWLKQ